MRYSGKPAAIWLLLLALSVGTAVGQAPPRHVMRPPVEQSLSAARRLLRNGRHAQAITQLEQLHQRHPGDLRVVLVLGTAYDQTGAYDEAARLYRGQIERTGGRNTDLWIQLANAQRHGGLAVESVATLLEALRQHPNWVRRLSDQFELATTDSARGADALEYMRVQAGDPAAPPVWREALGRAYIVRGAYQEAIGLLAGIERERRTNGTLLFEMAVSLARRGEPEAALAAFDSVLAISPDQGTAEESLFEKADLHAQRGDPAAAVAALEQLTARFPQGALAMRSRLQRGQLLMSPLGRLDAAQEAFREILAATDARRTRRGPAAVLRGEALLGLGECALRSGDLVLADTTFGRIEEEAVRTATKEQAAFERAEIFFYQGSFAEAEEAYYGLTDHYPNGQWVNDALARALLLGEYALSAGPALETYARVLYLRRIGALTDARAACREGIADSSAAALRGHLRFEELRLCGDQGQWAVADSVLAVLLDEDAESRVLAAAIYWMAAATEADPARRELAVPLYEKVILRRPDSLEARRARARLSALREAAQRPQGA